MERCVDREKERERIALIQSNKGVDNYLSMRRGRRNGWSSAWA